ncbi:elongator complex protein 4 [Pararge aegeria]|uniref:elongator complex protein 4 n=1 Tax=Pararge aegeria TaxID=116150 RepID=UPI0019D01278|nr:elongator complex protein 4 [Pararge aegeria]XP_039746262.1 elongator complex protein 4 [Pararge aegeria]
MTSFHKASAFHTSLKGTKLKNNLIYISSGIPSLDFIIGGGLSAGSVFLVEEDVLGSYGRVLSKYFLAEGVVCKHDLYVISADESPEDIVKELPQPCIVPTNEKTSNQGSSAEMKIAWRYEGLGQVESSFGSNTKFGHHFDLSKHIDEDTLKNCNITYCHLLENNKQVNGFKNGLYHTLLTNIKTILSKEDYKSSSQNKNILRICIQSLGSPVWMAMDCDDAQSGYGQDLIKFLYCLRMLVRDTNAVIFITIPSHLFDDENIIKRILYSVDNAVRIESFTGSSKETNPVYSDYHGLFHITKLSALYTLVPFVPPSLDLAFKLRRKKFVIEKLHLPPELQESSEREQDDITAIPKTCGGFKKKDVDF